MDNIEHISKQAAEFLLKIKSSENVDRTQFNCWLEEAPMHRIVFNDMAEDWQLMDEALSAQQQPQTPVTKPAANVRRFAQPKQWLAVAATAVLAIGVIFNQLASMQKQSLNYQTAQTQLNHTLEDGSVLDLNVGSKVSVEFSPEQRLLRLEQGDLAIQVAPDPSRPLIVAYKEHRFTALGTAFTVTTRPKLQLLVTEHSVGVESEDKAQLVVEEGRGLIHNDSWQAVDEQELSHINAWQHARHIFSDQSLKEVLDTLRPYFSEQIRLVNLSVMDEKVSGAFDMTSPKESLALIAEGMGLQVRFQSDAIILY